MKDSLTKNGYNQEEIYFHKLNQKLIQKLKENQANQENQEGQEKGPARPTLRLVHSQENSTVEKRPEPRAQVKLKKVA